MQWRWLTEGKLLFAVYAFWQVTYPLFSGSDFFSVDQRAHLMIQQALFVCFFLVLICPCTLLVPDIQL